MHDFMASGKTLNLVFESDELQFRICKMIPCQSVLSIVLKLE